MDGVANVGGFIEKTVDVLVLQWLEARGLVEVVSAGLVAALRVGGPLEG